MRLSKYETRELRAAKMKMALEGHGKYVYENNTGGDLILPKPTSSGQRNISKGQQFQGDDYYMQMVKSNDLRLVRTIQSPQQEQTMNEQKLILDQPETFTDKGQVEFVTPEDGQPLNETPKSEQTNETTDVLLNEAPIDGLEIDID